jgi:hypothetical protein
MLEKLKPFPLQSGTTQECPHSTLLFSIILEFLARVVRQEEEIKGIQIGEKRVKVSLFADDMILYLKDTKNSIQNLLDNTNSFRNVAGYKINLQVAFVYTNNEEIEKEYRKTIPFTVISKKKIKYLGMNLTKDAHDLYKENYKLLKKETAEDSRWCKDLPC